MKTVNLTTSNSFPQLLAELEAIRIIKSDAEAREKAIKKELLQYTGGEEGTLIGANGAELVIETASRRMPAKEAYVQTFFQYVIKNLGRA